MRNPLKAANEAKQATEHVGGLLAVVMGAMAGEEGEYKMDGVEIKAYRCKDEQGRSVLRIDMIGEQEVADGNENGATVPIGA